MLTKTSKMLNSSILLRWIVSSLLLGSSSARSGLPSGAGPAAVTLPRSQHNMRKVASIRGGSSEVMISYATAAETLRVPPPPPVTASELIPDFNTKNMARAEEAISTVWARHRRWSLAADRQQRKIHFYRNAYLGLVVAGAFFQTLAVRFHTNKYGWLIALIGGACLGAAPLLSNSCLSKETKSDWIRSRATSEQIKAQVFLFRAGVLPYDDTADDPVQALVNTVAEITEAAKDLKVEFVMTKPDGKKPPPPLDRSGYIKHRLDAQIDGFFIRTARNKATTSTQLRNCQGILAVASSLIGIIAGSAGGAAASVNAGEGGQVMFSHLVRNTGIWGATLATAASAFGSHAASGKYDDQALERSATAQRLENLYLRLPKSVGPGSPEWTAFVLQCEAVLASNRQYWANLLGSSSGEKKQQ